MCRAILARIKAAGINYRSTVRGPMDMQVSTEFGGNGLYWNEPDGQLCTAGALSTPVSDCCAGIFYLLRL